MIVREGQIWRKISDVKEDSNLRLVDCSIDYEVEDTLDDLGILMKPLNGKEAKRYSLGYIEDNFIYIFTPGEEEEPKIKIGDVVIIRCNNKKIQVTDYHEKLNFWYGKECDGDTEDWRSFITFRDSDVVSVLDGSIKEPKNKYHRDLKGVTVDVYDVLKAFEVTDPALQHLIKKALCAGLRGHKNKDQDLQDILDSAKRAVELNK